MMTIVSKVTSQGQHITRGEVNVTIMDRPHYARVAILKSATYVLSSTKEALLNNSL